MISPAAEIGVSREKVNEAVESEPLEKTAYALPSPNDFPAAVIGNPPDLLGNRLVASGLGNTERPSWTCRRG